MPEDRLSIFHIKRDATMCGICGQYNSRSRTPAEREIIEKMTRSLAHRGPDDEGYYLSGPLGLGFRRLSIIDLEGGHQPMTDRAQSVWVVFNGEIYNYPELRAELLGKGHAFRTQSDTEVILHGYKQWGLDVFNHLNGMFGLAIWDVERRRLVLARDSMGIKMVYYRLTEDTVQFGSEIRAVVAAEETKPVVDPVALNLLLRYRFCPSPFTVYKGIRKLAPGTMLVIEEGKAQVRRWYNFKPEPFSPMPSDQEAREQLLHMYKRAVKRHLLSDVPVGLLLSGGVDSGLLLGLMNGEGSSWPTFTVGFGSEFKEDELADGAETAQILGAKHTSVHIDRPTFEESLPRIVACLEEPIAASSIVPMYFVCQRARRDVKVALNGQGPDELFGGYRRHLAVQYGSFWTQVPKWVRQPVGAAINALPRNETLKRGVYSLEAKDRLGFYQQVLSLAPAERIDSLFHQGVLPQGAGNAIFQSWQDLVPLMEHTDMLGGFQFLELRCTLPDELLMYADKLSMAHSLEVRVPYLDRELVEWVERLGASFKVRNGGGKWLHREVCKSFLPRKILSRKKRGFASNVVDDWFRKTLVGKLPELLRDNTSFMFDLLDPKSVKKLFEEHKTGRHDNHKILFSLISFEEWLRSHSSSN